MPLAGGDGIIPYRRDDKWILLGSDNSEAECPAKEDPAPGRPGWDVRPFTRVTGAVCRRGNAGGSLDGIVERRSAGPNESIGGRKHRRRWRCYFFLQVNIVNYVMVPKKSFLCKGLAVPDSGPSVGGHSRGALPAAGVAAAGVAAAPQAV